ncbi:MAG: hypothetical protein Q4B61_01405, partial [Bacteroidales bacterium]|nr:hypothetical protein [Bacteroidales bacterium]
MAFFKKLCKITFFIRIFKDFLDRRLISHSSFCILHFLYYLCIAFLDFRQKIIEEYYGGLENLILSILKIFKEMEKFQLSGELRADLGKKATKETRANGL